MPSMEGKGTGAAEGSILKDRERHGHEGTTCLRKEVALDAHLGRPFSSLLMQRIPLTALRDSNNG